MDHGERNVMMRTKIREGGMEKYDYSILEVCETLHMAKTGAADPLSDEDSAKLRAYLITRRMDWYSPTCDYDLAVWNLMTAALEEYE